MEDNKCLTGWDQYCLGKVIRHKKYRLTHNSVQVFTNTRNRNVIYQKAGLIHHVVNLKIFTAPPIVPSFRVSYWQQGSDIVFLHKL